MDFLLVAAAAAFASGLTMFSGFGLGTLLLPVFALFFPLDLAIAATALVHCANNVLKTSLLGKFADGGIVLRFGVSAIIAAFLGAYVLSLFSSFEPLATYRFLGNVASITPLKILLALLMAVFAVFELHPSFEKLEFDRKYLPLGGVLSGFFGGLSGHQGALRSAFLAKTGILAEAFVGTNAVIGLLVDLIRLTAYGAILFGARLHELALSREGALVFTGTLAAFTGVIVGKRLLKKITMKTVQQITGALLLLISALLGAGII